jgi:hypothetical protein
MCSIVHIAPEQVTGAPGRIRTRDPLLRRHRRTIAACRPVSLTIPLTALTVAGYGLVSPGESGCWLPVWLPEVAASLGVRINQRPRSVLSGNAAFLRCRADPVIVAVRERGPRDEAEPRQLEVLRLAGGGLFPLVELTAAVSATNTRARPRAFRGLRCGWSGRPCARMAAAVGR